VFHQVIKTRPFRKYVRKFRISHSGRNIYRSSTAINKSQRGKKRSGEEDGKLVIIEPGLGLTRVRNTYVKENQSVDSPSEFACIFKLTQLTNFTTSRMRLEGLLAYETDLLKGGKCGLDSVDTG
jgi:hypothetical protein